LSSTQPHDLIQLLSSRRSIAPRFARIESFFKKTLKFDNLVPMDSSMANIFVLEGPMQVEKLLCVLIFVGLASSSCFQLGNSSLGTVRTTSEVGVKSTAVSETKNIAVIDPLSTSDQRLTTSEASPISGSNVVVSPGTLGIGASLILEQGANFADTSVGNEVTLAGDVSIQGTTAGLIIRPSEAVSLKKPLTISMPLPTSTGLHLADSNFYLVFYKSYDPITGELLTGTKAVDGVNARLVFDTSTNRDSVSFEGYFGAYWVAKVNREVKTAELPSAKASTEPVININRVAVIDQKGIVKETAIVATQAAPEVTWGAIQSGFQATNRSLKVTASIATGRVLSLCKADLTDDKTFNKFITYEAGNSLTYEYMILRRTAHDLFARFRCNDDLGRFTVSPWSQANSIPSATPSAPKDVAFSSPAGMNLSADVQWASDSAIGFAEHRVKLCANKDCSFACGPEISVKTSPAMASGSAGANLYACVKSVENSGLVSPWVASTNPIPFPISTLPGANIPPSSSTGPTVTNVTTTSTTGNYTVGMIIPIHVTFSGVVIVNGGNPSIDLAVTPSAAAHYVTGSGTQTLTFNYTVGSGQSAAHLNYIAIDSLRLNGATIRSANGIDAIRMLPLPTSALSLGSTSNIAIVISNSPPTIPGSLPARTLIIGNALPSIDINDLITNSDIDQDGDPLNYSCHFSMSTNNTVYNTLSDCSNLIGAFSLNPSTGVFNWTASAGAAPFTGHVADYQFQITANDGHGNNANTNFNVSVLAPSEFLYGYDYNGSGDYAFDFNLIDYNNGHARLRPIDQTDNDTTSAGFGSGVPQGILFDGNHIRLGLSSTCNGLSSNCNNVTSLTAMLNSYRNYYNMDGSTPSANSLSTISGGTATSDSKVGLKALQLNGTSDFATIPGNLTDSFTVSFWVRTSNPYSPCTDFHTGIGLVSGRHSSLANDWGISICDGKIVAGTDASITSTVPINNSKWHLINFSRNLSTGVIKLYIDGRLDATTTATTASLTNSPILNIGNHPNLSNFFGGAIDELAVYTSVLTDEHIQFQYEMQKPRLSGFLVSQVMDSKSVNSRWLSLDWKTALPNGKQLPDYNAGIINETIADYSGLSDSGLMNSNIGLWHLNEKTVGSVSGGSMDFLDNSGTMAHGKIYGPTPTFISEKGKLRDSIKLTPSAYAKMQSSAFELGSSSLTASAWIRFKGTSNSKIFGTGWITPSTGWTLDTSSGKLSFSIGSAMLTAATSASIETTSTFNDNEWHLMTGVLDQSAKTMKIFVDGKQQPVAIHSQGTCGSLTGATLSVSTCSNLSANGGQYSYLGGTSGTATLDGSIDEVALWSRALSDIEAKNLFLRAANRVKFQIKSCNQADCSDGALTGHSNNDTSFYSEFFNSTYSTDLTKPTAPNLTFTDTGASNPANNRYFQYKVILESDDSNTLCSYGAAANCSPEVQSVHVGPDHYPPFAEINYLQSVPFYSLYNLTEVIGPEGCPHGVRYVLSRNGTDWFTYAPTSWQPWTSGFASATPVSGINAGAGLFGSQVGRDTFYIKAILGSTGESACQLNEINAQFNHSF
jgi:hypothetical protein